MLNSILLCTRKPVNGMVFVLVETCSVQNLEYFDYYFVKSGVDKSRNCSYSRWIYNLVSRLIIGVSVPLTGRRKWWEKQ